MKLTDKQLKVLTWLRDHKNDTDGDISCEGIHCWYGGNKTNWKLVNSLLELVLISRDSYSDKSFQRFTINECGERALDGLPPYCDTNGNYFNDFYELMAAEK